MDEVTLFAETFKKYQSDKTGYHTYERVYSSLFEDRSVVNNVLEVGIHLGSSLRAWRELFPNANIIGLENNTERFFTEERILSMYVDQSIMETFDHFKSVMRGTEFEFIVDDGCHYLQETKDTFKQLLPLLKVGGWFVVEDIREEFEEEWKLIAENLGSSYGHSLINMNDIAETNGKDNIVFAVRRLK
jgi:cobalamin biosynthesis Co2+ chelatase CbiK